MGVVGSLTTPRLELGQALLEYDAEKYADKYIADKALPIFGTPKKAANFPAVTRETLLGRGDVKRNKGSHFNRSDVGIEEKSFNCIGYGHESVCDDEDRELYKNDFDLGMVKAKKCWTVLRTEWELRVSALVFNTTTFTGADLYTDNSGSPWSTSSTDIRAQIDAARIIVEANCGISPNTLIVNNVVYQNMLNNDDIRNAILYNQIPTRDAIMDNLAGLLGLDRILVAGARYNSDEENVTPAFTGTSIWSNLYAMLCITSDGDLSEPSLGRNFLWENMGNGPITVESYRSEDIQSEVYRAKHWVDEVIIDAYFGHLMKVRTS